MGLSLNNIYQRPYVNPDGRNRINKRDEEEKKSSASSSKREEEAGQNSRSKGLQYADNQSKQDYPVYEKKFNLPPTAYNNVNINRPAVRFNLNEIQAQNSLEQNRIDSQINIAQILKDFKNTSIAIGTPQDLQDEVESYLNLINKQVVKDHPNEKLIKSNLKNAASILDNHISNTLKKDSKVVENWVDTLFLQKIDFHYNENDINERFLVKFPEGSSQADSKSEVKNIAESETITQENIETNVIPISVAKSNIPQDKQLKSLFIQAKKYAYTKDPGNAIRLFEKALNRANELDDTETSGKIYYEVGKIYDDHDYVVQALKSYNQSIKLTTDENVKTKAHYSMAQIYDDVNQITPALDHYISTISHAGEAENLPAQSASLTKIGNIYSDMYDKEAFNYYDTAKDIAKETKNYNLRGYVASSTGKAHVKFEQPKEALESFSHAVKDYTKAETPAKAAQNYLAAADVMVEYNNPAKASKLLQKAQKYARQTDNIGLMNEINTKIRQLKQLEN